MRVANSWGKEKEDSPGGCPDVSTVGSGTQEVIAERSDKGVGAGRGRCYEWVQVEGSPFGQH